jgi:hypothetical protein
LLRCSHFANCKVREILLSKYEYYSGDKNEENKMVMACVMDEEEGKYTRGFCGED